MQRVPYHSWSVTAVSDVNGFQNNICILKERRLSSRERERGGKREREKEEESEKESRKD